MLNQSYNNLYNSRTQRCCHGVDVSQPRGPLWTAEVFAKW